MSRIPTSTTQYIAHPCRRVCTDPAKLFETTFSIIDLLDPILGVSESSFEGVLERFEPGVEFEDTCSC